MNPGAHRLRTLFAELKRRQLMAHDRLHPQIRLYQLGLVHARLGDAAAGRRYAGQQVGVELPRTAGTLAEDLARSVRAQILIREGRLEELWQDADSPLQPQVVAAPARSADLLARDQAEPLP